MRTSAISCRWEQITENPARCWLRWSHELHRFRGNLLFADAHVDQLADEGLAAAAAAISGGPQVLNLPADVTVLQPGSSTASLPPLGASADSARPPGDSNTHTTRKAGAVT